MVRIVIAEDQSLLRGALSTLLALEEDIDVIGAASDGADALEMVLQLKPDVLVTDIEMPRLSGIDLAKAVKESEAQTSILIVTTFARPGYLERARRAGVTGYVLKDTPSDALANAVRKVAAGEVVLDKELIEAAWATPDPLTERERDILRLAEAGKTNKEIGSALTLSPGTVRNYLAEATQKLGANNRIEAFRIARENGWL